MHRRDLLRAAALTVGAAAAGLGVDAAGAFDAGPGRTLYIDRALGHLRRVRFNVRPELTLFTLVRE